MEGDIVYIIYLSTYLFYHSLIRGRFCPRVKKKKQAIWIFFQDLLSTGQDITCTCACTYMIKLRTKTLLERYEILLHLKKRTRQIN